MPLIRQVRIERFRGIQSLVWAPGPGINGLIGPGDSGKSTILDAIDLLLSARRTSTFTRFIHEPSRQGVADPALRFGGGHGTQCLVARGTARFRVFAVLRGQGLIDGTAASALGWLRAS